MYFMYYIALILVLKEECKIFACKAPSSNDDTDFCSETLIN
jgi:hypothetical protein